MLTDQHRLLIAAHVDGGLSPERQQAVVRLLDHSAEARDLFGKLQVDARRVQTLPRTTLPPDFAQRILSRLPADDGKIVVRVSTPRPDSVRLLLKRILSAAAVLFVCVGIGLYWVFTSGPQVPRPEPELAERPPAPAAPSDVPVAEPIVPVEPAPSQPPVVEQRADNADPTAPPTIAKADPAVAVTPTPAPPPAVLTAPSIPQARMETVIPPRLSLPVALKSLINEDSFFRLRAELTKDAAHRVEIFCRDPSRVGERLAAACRDLGVRLIIETAAQQAQKQRARIGYLLYSDSFTAEEWAVFFHNLGYYDRRAEEKKAGDAIFEQLVITPLMPATDQKELLNHIGTDVLTPVARATTSEDGKTTPKPLIRQALLMPYIPQRGIASAAKEIKQFLDARQERRGGQIAVMIVIKPL
jgi:hypothetical protein